MKFRGSMRFVIGGMFLFALFVFAKVDGGFLAWFLLYISMLLFIYELASKWLTMRNLQVSRKVSANHLSASQSIQVEIVFARNHPWPMFWAKVSDCLPDRLSIHAKNSIQSFTPLWNKQFVCSYQIPDLPRGIHHLDEIWVESGDLLGLQRLTSVYNAYQQIIVYPQIVPVRGWRGIYSEETGEKQSMSRRTEESTNVIGVRQYVPGDKLSRIHWPLSARIGQLQSKEFELHVTSDYIMIPDTSINSFAKANGDKLFDFTMTISASLMKYALDMKRRFGAIIHSNRLIRLEPGRGETLFLKCMETFAELQPICIIPFARSLERIAGSLPAGCTFVIISPDLSTEMVSAISSLRKRGPVEWFVPLPGSGSSSDPELTSEMIRLMQNSGLRRVAIHFIGKPEHLSSLTRKWPY